MTDECDHRDPVPACSFIFGKRFSLILVDFFEMVGKGNPDVFHFITHVERILD